MDNLRKYGSVPFSVAVIHGGPGAPGGVAPVARELSNDMGVLEPLQTASTLVNQVEELKNVLMENGDRPVTLVGWSWGAFLGYILTARYPKLTKKLILVGSGGFEKKYGAKTMETRLSRLSGEERAQVQSVMTAMRNPDVETGDSNFAEIGKLFGKTDSCNPIECESDVIEVQQDIFKSVWSDAEKIRASGRLLQMGGLIQCPVVAIHGDYDPHPAEGVREPLARVLKDFRFILLEKCGHEPWNEKDAKDEFYTILKDELN